MFAFPLRNCKIIGIYRDIRIHAKLYALVLLLWQLLIVTELNRTFEIKLISFANKTFSEINSFMQSSLYTRSCFLSVSKLASPFGSSTLSFKMKHLSKEFPRSLGCLIKCKRRKLVTSPHKTRLLLNYESYKHEDSKLASYYVVHIKILNWTINLLNSTGVGKGWAIFLNVNVALSIGAKEKADVKV